MGHSDLATFCLLCLPTSSEIDVIVRAYTKTMDKRYQTLSLIEFIWHVLEGR